MDILVKSDGIVFTLVCEGLVIWCREFYIFGFKFSPFGRIIVPDNN